MEQRPASFGQTPKERLKTQKTQACGSPSAPPQPPAVDEDDVPLSRLPPPAPVEGEVDAHGVVAGPAVGQGRLEHGLDHAPVLVLAGGKPILW